MEIELDADRLRRGAESVDGGGRQRSTPLFAPIVTPADLPDLGEECSGNPDDNHAEPNATRGSTVAEGADDGEDCGHAACHEQPSDRADRHDPELKWLEAALDGPGRRTPEPRESGEPLGSFDGPRRERRQD